jgi:hypothetical protein
MRSYEWMVDNIWVDSLVNEAILFDWTKDKIMIWFDDKYSVLCYKEKVDGNEKMFGFSCLKMCWDCVVIFLSNLDHKEEFFLVLLVSKWEMII